MKKAIFGVLLSCLCFTFPLSAQESGRIRIGLIAPLSGPYAAFGMALKNGIELALKESGVSSRISMFWEDDQFLPQHTIAAFNKLVEIDHVNLVISCASTPSMAIAPLAESRRVPLLAWASDGNVTKNRRFSIRTYPSGEREGQVIAAEALRRGNRKIAAFHVVSDYAQSVWHGFSKSKAASEIVLEEEVPPELSDFRSLVLKARAAGAGAFFVCLNPGQAGVFARQAQEAKLPLNFFGCENLNSLEEFDLARGALDSAWFVSAGVQEDFRRRYRAAYGNEDVLSGAAIHYDLIKLIDSTFTRAYSAEETIDRLLSGAAISAGVSWGQFKKTETDQFLDLRLNVKQMSELRQ